MPHPDPDISGDGTDLRSAARAAYLVGQGLEIAQSHILPGATTGEIASRIRRYLIAEGVDSDPIIHTSPEPVVWHGMPDSHPLPVGTLVTFDIACSIGGRWADGAATFGVGRIDGERRRLIAAAGELTRRLIHVMRAGTTGLVESALIADFCRSSGCTLVNEGAGHGIGRRLHQWPSITYDGRCHEPLTSGLCYTVEPVICTGDGRISLEGDSSAVCLDRSPSAHFEVTVLLTDSGARVLRSLNG